MAGGRPTKYDPKFCRVILDMAKQGKSVVQMSAHLEIARSTFYEWIKNEPEFSDTFDIAKEIMESFWEDVLDRELLGLGEKPLNSMLFKFKVASRCSWRDATEELQQDKTLTINIVNPNGQNGNDQSN